MTTSNNDGSFVASWTATPRYDGGAYDFYAVFEGHTDYSYARSTTHSVRIAELSTSSELVLNPIPARIFAGETITFTGKLTSQDKGSAVRLFALPTTTFERGERQGF